MKKAKISTIMYKLAKEKKDGWSWMKEEKKWNREPYISTSMSNREYLYDSLIDRMKRCLQVSFSLDLICYLAHGIIFFFFFLSLHQLWFPKVWIGCWIEEALFKARERFINHIHTWNEFLYTYPSLWQSESKTYTQRERKRKMIEALYSILKQQSPFSSSR